MVSASSASTRRAFMPSVPATRALASRALGSTASCSPGSSLTKSPVGRLGHRRIPLGALMYPLVGQRNGIGPSRGKIGVRSTDGAAAELVVESPRARQPGRRVGVTVSAAGGRSSWGSERAHRSGSLGVIDPTTSPDRSNVSSDRSEVVQGRHQADLPPTGEVESL